MRVEVFTDKEINSFLTEYKDYLKEPPTSNIMAYFKINNTTVTIYPSRKVLFQGEDIEMFNKYFKEEIDEYPFDSVNTIGADEVGTGDFFGPIVVAACLVKPENIDKLKELGVRDSKKISDKRIVELVENTKDIVDVNITLLSNEKYNQIVDDYNLNEIKAKLHNHTINKLSKKVKYDEILLDAFCSKEKYLEYLKGEDVLELHLLEKAESKSLSVAMASIYARYYFLLEIDKLSKQYNYHLIKGASSLVDDLIKKILDDGNEDILKYIAKLNYKNYKKIKA